MSNEQLISEVEKIIVTLKIRGNDISEQKVTKIINTLTEVKKAL
jgi:hypothetical protein